MTAKSKAWLKARKIGGSSAAAIIGAHPYKTAYEVWERLTGATTGEIKMNLAMKMGVLLEPVAADLYVEETGRKVRNRKQRSHPDYPFITGNIDREILSQVDKPAGILEIKCPTIHTMAKVKREGLRDDMVVQLQHYMGVYGYEWGSFALFNQDAGFIYFDVEADQDFISTLIEKEIEFWENHVVPKIPPPQEVEEEIDIPRVEGALIMVDDAEWREAATNLQEARALKKTAAELELTAKEKIQELMAEQGANAVEIPSFARFYYKNYDGNTAWKPTAAAIALAAELNVDDYIVKGKESRRFLPYFLKQLED